MARELETSTEIRSAAIALLARREYSRAELERKLGGRVADPRMLEQALDQLQDDGYQSDRRFTEVFVRSRLGSGYGQMRIRQELQRKGIDRDSIERVLEEQEMDSRQLACECHQRRFGETTSSNPKDYARRMRFLVNRGFSFEDARYAIIHGAEAPD
ncbi:regulatory protein RecX [Marinobacterium marinum]|uniref:Regulatory protein RecX n=1 Tax=Marinobacterium marinum TaxID=2756129 RepID=A0A7W1WYW3_9GAMM|nr:regulatory protein RecX [Marinobacterium marinum]MBA4502775.1 regulatory protein RecX [Marinobacterium marinum]